MPDTDVTSAQAALSRIGTDSAGIPPLGNAAQHGYLPSYWLSGRPYLDEVDVRIIKDPQAQLAQLEAGAVDFVLSPTLRDFARLRADSDYVGLLHPYAGTFYMQGVNVLNTPFDNKLVRQALSYAIDRKHIADSVLLGTGQPTSMPWLSNSAAYEASKDQFFTFDPDKAKSLLAQAGVSELTCQMLPIPSNPELVDMAQIYQADLAKIGVSLNITQVDAASWFDMANNRKYNGFYSTLNGLAQLEPITLLLGGRVYDPNSNNSGYQNDAYASLLNQAASEPDKSKRQALYSQINDILLDQAWAMPIATGQPRVLTRANRSRYRLHAVELILLHQRLGQLTGGSDLICGQADLESRVPMRVDVVSPGPGCGRSRQESPDRLRLTPFNIDGAELAARQSLALRVAMSMPKRCGGWQDAETRLYGFRRRWNHCFCAPDLGICTPIRPILKGIS